ncbi:MAG: MFS transporter [Acidobacteria bacterium]|nr:MFS transporter [Acidobacteriota bacterium]
MDLPRTPTDEPQLEAAKSRDFGTAWRALRHRNFRLFFFGQMISVTGTWMQSVAQSWLVYRMTGSAMLLGLVGFATQIPTLLAPLGGVAADRYNRHRLVILTQGLAMVQALLLALLTLTGRIQVWQVFALSVFLGLINALDNPTRQSFLVQLVGRRDLMNAIVLNSSVVNGARILGPALAGILVSLVGEGPCFLINGVSYGAVIMGLLLLKLEQHRPRPQPGSVSSFLKEGFEFARSSRPIRSLLALLGLTSLMGMPYSVLMPIFADRILLGGPRGLGILMGSAGAGALVGTFLLAFKRDVRGLGRLNAATAALFGSALMFFSLSRNFWLSVLCLFPVGFAMKMHMACSNSLLQALVREEFRGRVMSFYSMMFLGMAPIGSLMAGAVASRWGAPFAVALGGAFCVGGAVWFYRSLPRFREEARHSLVAHGALPGEPIGSNADLGLRESL